MHVPPWHHLILSKHHPSITRLCPWTCCFLKTSIVLYCSWCMIGSTSLGSEVKLVFLCLSKYVVNMVYWNKSHGSRREWGFMFETLWKGFLDCLTAGSQVVSFTPFSNHLSIWSFFEMMMLIFTFRNGSVVILAVTKNMSELAFSSKHNDVHVQWTQ